MINLSRAGLCLLFLAAVGGASANLVSGAEKININTAPLEDLVKIIHIGEARAKELISLRPFSSLDDLAEINGIGASRIADIKKQGLAWVDESEVRPPQNKEMSAIGEQTPGTADSFSIFLIAGLIAIFSAAIILALEKKTKVEVR